MKISENFSAKGDEPGKRMERRIADSRFQISKRGKRERTKEGDFRKFNFARDNSRWLDIGRDRASFGWGLVEVA